MMMMMDESRGLCTQLHTAFCQHSIFNHFAELIYFIRIVDTKIRCIEMYSILHLFYYFFAGQNSIQVFIQFTFKFCGSSYQN
jgi:hypothetical protein